MFHRFITFQPREDSGFTTVSVADISTVDFALEDPDPGPNGKHWPVTVTLRSGRKVLAYHSDDATDNGYTDSLDAYGALERCLGSVQFSGAHSEGADLAREFPSTRP